MSEVGMEGKGCPECGVEVGVEATTCPTCGSPLTRSGTSSGRRRLAGLTGAALVLGTFVWCAVTSRDAVIYWIVSVSGVVVAFALLGLILRIRRTPLRTLPGCVVVFAAVLGSVVSVGLAVAATFYQDEMFGDAFTSALVMIASLPFGFGFGLVFGAAAALLLYGMRGETHPPPPPA